MLIHSHDDLEIIVCSAVQSDLEDLLIYFNKLSKKSQKHFSPHPFDKKEVLKILSAHDKYHCFIGREKSKGKIIAYSIIKSGYIKHDLKRLKQSEFALDSTSDCTYAPSVADDFQGKGIASFMLHHIKEVLTSNGFKRIILWGGVHCENTNAVNFYRKHSFTIINAFEHKGRNIDMALFL